MSRTSIQRLADEAPVADANSWPSRKPPSPAYDAACAALETQAIKNVTYMVKGCARAYRLQPHELEKIAQGLSNLSPRDLVTALKQFRAIQMIRGYGEIPPVNFKGALLYGRYSRAKARQIARRAA